MDTRHIRERIASSVRDDEATGDLGKLLRRAAANNGRHLDDDSAGVIADWIKGYIGSVPSMIEYIELAAHQAGVGAEVTRVLTPAANYWNEPHDLMPDHQGLVGLLDDAYVFLSVMERTSDNHGKRVGRPLIDVELSQANSWARQLIGQPVVGQLDMIISGILQGPSMQAALQALALLAQNFRPLPAPPDPIWGNASTDEIVKVRMGAMGFV